MKTENQELAILPPKESAIAVYSAGNGLDPYLAQIRAEIDAFIPDATTKKGRDAIASIAYKVAKSKTALDNLGKELVAELKDVPKKIDAERKRMRDTLDAWKDEVRKPLTDFELAEAARIARHEENINWFNMRLINSELDAIELSADIEKCESIVIDSSYEEFESKAVIAKSNAIESLKKQLAVVQKREAEQAELEKLRAESAAREQKEREERIARESAESARIAAENAAATERQRLADEQLRKDREAQAAIDRAEREKLEAENARLRQIQEAEQSAVKAKQDAIDAAARAEREKQAAIDAERKRQADAAEAERLETEAREKNKAHAKKINNEALDDLVEIGLSPELAKAVVVAIAKGAVRNVKISY